MERLRDQRDCQVTAVSDYLVTAPYGGVEQDDFLNGALELPDAAGTGGTVGCAP